MTFDEILYKSHNTLIKMLEQKYDGMTNGEVIESLFPNVGTNFSNVLDLNLWWKAKYKLKNEIHCNCTDEEIAKSFIEDVKAVEDLLPPVTPKQPMWIPCSERLPEANGRYVVTRGLNACGALWNRVYIVNYSDLMGIKSERIWWDGNVGKSDFERFDDVIAWKPLPEPYKAESEE
jgi:hypothetical protein